MKWVNRVLNQYLKKYVSADQCDWMDYVGLVELNYNAATYLGTKKLLFNVAYRVNPLQYGDLVLEKVQ